MKKSTVILAVIILFIGIIIAFISIDGKEKGKKNTNIYLDSGSNQSSVDSVVNKNENFNTAKKILIDAGHGGKDPGSVYGEIYEKDLNLDIALRLKSILEEQNFEVIMTRDSDSTVYLSDRVELAEKENADLLISIHVNSTEEENIASGIECYYQEKNIELASIIQKNIIEESNEKDRGIKEGNDLYILNQVSMPAILIETGFITSQSDRELLLSEKFQDDMARGIMKGIQEFFENKSEVDIGNQEELVEKEITEEEITEENPDEKVVYLTIDDGPSENTDRILDILDQYQAKATWFVTAQYMDESNLVMKMKEISERGHTLGVHSYSHDYSDIYQSLDRFKEDFRRMNALIKQATGAESKLFRFPGGSNTGRNASSRDEILDFFEEEGIIYYDWNAFTGDTDGLTKEQMVSKAITESTYNNKTILLMHDVPDKASIVDVLPQIMEELHYKGYKFKALIDTVKPIQFVI